MTDALPPPLVQADCDCRGLPFMPLEVVRLIESDLVALSTGDEFKAAVILWAKSWLQSPAASLPNDDRILARFAGYSLNEWMGLRPMALKGWVLCSDERLYHPLIGDLAAKAFAQRRGQSERANSRWARARADKQPKIIPAHDPGDATASADDATVMQGRGTVEGRESPQPPLNGGTSDLFEQALAAYPQAGRASTHRVKSVEAWADAREIEPPDRLLMAVKTFAASDYAAADRGKRVPSFHRWLREGRFLVWLPKSTCTAGFAGPSDFRAAVVDAQGEPFAVGYLDRCAWRDLPERALIAPNEFIAATLRREIRPVLIKFDVPVIVAGDRPEPVRIAS